MKRTVTVSARPTVIPEEGRRHRVQNPRAQAARGASEIAARTHSRGQTAHSMQASSPASRAPAGAGHRPRAQGGRRGTGPPASPALLCWYSGPARRAPGGDRPCPAPADRPSRTQLVWGERKGGPESGWPAPQSLRLPSLSFLPTGQAACGCGCGSGSEQGAGTRQGCLGLAVPARWGRGPDRAVTGSGRAVRGGRGQGGWHLGRAGPGLPRPRPARRRRWNPGGTSSSARWDHPVLRVRQRRQHTLAAPMPQGRPWGGCPPR